jgi:hypothetical protein
MPACHFPAAFGVVSGMRKALSAIAVAAIVVNGLAAAATAAPFSRTSTITIRNDRGGTIIRYALKSREIAESGRQLRFAGRCLSACTLYLSVSKSCVTPQASFGFHLPYGAGKDGNAVAVKYMIRSYPGWVRSWISARGGLNSQMKIMPYEYAARYLPTCKS